MNAAQNTERLSEFERRLQNRRASDLSPASRDRILHAVSQELSSRPLPHDRRGSFLSFAAAMAAVLIVSLNLAITAPSGNSFDHRAKPTRQQTLDTAEMLRQLSPDISPAEAARMAVALRGAGNQRPVSQTRTSAHSPRTLQ